MPAVKYKLDNNIALEPPDIIEDTTDEDGNGFIYLGWSKSGSNIATSTEAFRICRITITNDGANIVKEWAAGLIDYIFIWDDRAGLTYSFLKRV